MQILTFNNAMFDTLRERIDDALQNLMTDLHKSGSSKGSISISIKVALKDTDDFDDDTGNMVKAKFPIFTSNVRTSVSIEGTSALDISGSAEQLIYHDGADWMIRGRNDRQRSFFDGGDK